MKVYIFSALVGAALLTGCSQTQPETATQPASETGQVTQAFRRSASPSSSSTETQTSASVSSANAPAAQPSSAGGEEVALIKTTEGDMVIEFWPDVAPKTVDNFKKLAKEGFYDGTAFHRVIREFMIQGGDPLTKDPSKEALWGSGGPGYQVNAEFNNRSHQRGVVSMARSQDPNSAGSQFFICHGNPTFLDGQYTAFGKLIKGDEVLEKIATTSTHPPDRPDKRIGVESIKIVPASSVR